MLLSQLDPNNALLCYRTASTVFRRGDAALAQQILRHNIQDADLNLHLLDGQIANTLRDPDSARQSVRTQ